MDLESEEVKDIESSPDAVSKIRRGRSISPIPSSKAATGDKPPLFRKGRDASTVNAARQVPKFIKPYYP